MHNINVFMAEDEIFLSYFYVPYCKKNHRINITFEIKNFCYRRLCLEKHSDAEVIGLWSADPLSQELA